ncbi:MAG: hypothetical protein ACMG6E_07185, partial [Candidatus Roizmanbacteria bacterium]
ISYIKSQKVGREVTESKLNFLGFLIMQNKLKPVSTGVIETLNNANIRTVMATGDNVLTAVSVGRECSIIDAETEVFLGELKNDGGYEQIYWKSTQTPKHRLHGGTLEPNKQFYEDEKEKLGHHQASDEVTSSYY